MKFIFMLFDIGVILLIVGLLMHFSLNPSMSIIYAWSPLVLKEFPGSGHYDPVVIFLTMLSIYLFFKVHYLRAVIVLALATLSKMYSVVLLPFYLRFARKVNIVVFLAVLAICYIPFFDKHKNAAAVIHFAGLKAVSDSWNKPMEYYRNNVTGSINLYNTNNTIAGNVVTRHCPVNEGTLDFSIAFKPPSLKCFHLNAV